MATVTFFPTVTAAATATTWQSARQAEIKALTESSSLTDYIYVKTGETSIGASAASTAFGGDGSIEGGAIQTSSTVRVFSGSVFQTPKSGHWALEGRVLMGTTTANLRQFGLINGASTHDLTWAVSTADDASHFALRIDGAAITRAASTITADAVWHNMRLTGDGTTIRGYIDNVLVASTATSTTNLSDEPMGVFIAASAVGDTVKISEYIYGFVRP
jgi:hypothetical protein